MKDSKRKNAAITLQATSGLYDGCSPNARVQGALFRLQHRLPLRSSPVGHRQLVLVVPSTLRVAVHGLILYPIGLVDKCLRDRGIEQKNVHELVPVGARPESQKYNP